MGQNDFCTGKNVRPESALCGKREVRCSTSEFSLGGSSLRASPRSVGSRITSGTRSQHSQPLPQPFHVTIMSMRLASQNQPVIGSFNSSFVNGTLHRKACPPPPFPHLTTCCHPHPLCNPHPSSSPFAVPHRVHAAARREVDPPRHPAGPHLHVRRDQHRPGLLTTTCTVLSLLTTEKFRALCGPGRSRGR